MKRDTYYVARYDDDRLVGWIMSGETPLAAVTNFTLDVITEKRGKATKDIRGTLGGFWLGTPRQMRVAMPPPIIVLAPGYDVAWYGPAFIDAAKKASRLDASFVSAGAWQRVPPKRAAR